MIIEAIKANKGKIIKRALIIGGAALGLVIVAKAVSAKANAGGDEVELAEPGEVIDCDNDSNETSENNG